jgi:D-serine deaminase-like pyridoxal phosphate-dependent protein
MPYTPGPWIVRGTGGALLCVVNNEGAYIVDRFLLPHFMPDSERLANARLISAAPDLLASLMETRDAAAALMRAIAASGHATEVLDELEPGYDGFGVRAQAAIARATLSDPDKKEPT